jgi:alpha-L-fucosidase 2
MGSGRSAGTRLLWDFPLPRTHTGIVLGNGIQGLMVWGNDRLSITVGRAGFWDHRGGNAFSTRVTYLRVRALLERHDEPGLRAAFAGPGAGVSGPSRPQQYGCGRLDLQFGGGFVPRTGELRLATGEIRVICGAPDGRAATVRIGQARGAELAWADLDSDLLPGLKVSLVPAWEYIGDGLNKVGCVPPERWSDGEGGGFRQTLPDDDPVALAWRLRGGHLTLATALGADSARRATRATLGGTRRAGAAARRWWQAYWADVPRVSLPDPALQRAWDYSLHKQAGLTPPDGLAATLQGPWMEEYQPPPWSNDYHFNINVQMVYQPALATNRPEHFAPLWAMIRGWFPQLLAVGRAFFERDGAMMLPHAVDDRCQVVGSFWTGTIDQACAAWMAQLAWLHYRYTLDETVLRDVAWPLLNGAFEGYWAMLEPTTDEQGARRLSLPVSVSPEYNGSGMDAWGRDASFQLAALHAVAALLPKAAATLNEPNDPRWAQVSAELPPYTATGSGSGLMDMRRIALWRGQDLAESHRHHSHMACLYPFRTVDPRDPAHRGVIHGTVRHWLRKGPGCWTGWCVPWAAILCARCDMPDAAVTWLRWWSDVFNNVGGGTLHDADFPGASLMDYGALFADGPARRGEIMQMDAAMGLLSAVAELLVQCRGDAIHVLPAIPRRWRAFEFDGIRTEGAFLVGATVRDGAAQEVRVTSLKGQPLKLAHGMGEHWTLNGVSRTGPWMEAATAANERLVLRRAI